MFVDKDRYGRLVGKAYSKGVYLNELMVREGYSWWYRDYAKNEIALEMAEKAARKNKKEIR
jgi:endonuclease YncB( thermonuclease family)